MGGRLRAPRSRLSPRTPTTCCWSTTVWTPASASNLVREAVECAAATPTILLCDTDDADAVEGARAAGATDCLVHGELGPALLDHAIRGAIERRRIEVQIEQLVLYDQLTGLANRSLFRENLNRAIGRARHQDTMVGLMLLGVDRFKLINESLGHEAGDRLLRLVTARIADCLDKGLLLARFGSDEFAIVLADMAARQDAADLANQITAAMATPFEINGHDIFITIGMGIATYPLCGWDADSLSNCANTAMHRAKEQGRNQFQFYTRKMTAGELQRLVLQTSLHHALDRREFTLYYQPQIDIESGRVVGTEALLRWLHPDLGTLGPDQFIPIAEETGLIIPLGEWVLETACRQCKAWQNAGLPALRVAVNISPRQFREPALGTIIAAVLADSGLAARDLTLELTEGTLMEDFEASRITLARFRNMGLHLAIDDFGTGYSSLSYLKSFPIEVLKIDKSFVRDITTDPDDATIAAAIIGLAHNLRLGVVAEGVETAAQLDFLRAQGCDTVQGYLYSRPVPADDFAVLLQNGFGN